MELGTAQLLAGLNDPKGVSGLAKRGDDPRAAKAAAQQFAALLMQQMMQQNDGSAIAMAGGTGGGIVNTMFATMMGKTVASGEKVGLTDLLLRSIEKKQGAAAGSPAAAGAVAQAAGFPLGAYWQANGMRPPAAAAHSGAVPAPGAGVALSPYARMASLVLPRAEPPAAPAATAPPATGDPNIAAFTAQVAPLVQRAAQQLGVSPRILLAQAAIETGWGRSVVGNNLFGIKAGASWGGGRVTAPTHEYVDGRMVAITDAFRAYPSYEASVQDFVALVSKSPRYQAALGKGDDAAGYARALLAGGWATDIDYVRKLDAVAAGARATAPFRPAPPPSPTVPL